MKTCVPGKILQRGSRLLQGLRNPAGHDTTSELPAGNGRTGAPVTASMSDGSYAVTRVEPWNTAYCIPPLIFSGDGYFLYLPHIKKEVTTMSEEILYTFENPEYRKTF